MHQSRGKAGKFQWRLRVAADFCLAPAKAAMGDDQVGFILAPGDWVGRRRPPPSKRRPKKAVSSALVFSAVARRSDRDTESHNSRYTERLRSGDQPRSAAPRSDHGQLSFSKKV